MSTGLAVALLSGAAALVMALGALQVRTSRRARRLEEDTARLKDELESAHQAREAFFDLVTHELRSPLAAILGYQELLADGAYGSLEGATEPVERIGRSADHLLHLIDGVVELSRIRADAMVPDLQTVQLGVVVAAAADAFRTAAGERSLEPHVRMPESLPSIRSDQERLIRVLDLVVTSAIKYAAAAEIHLDVLAADHGATLRIHPTEIETRPDATDPALRLGLRLAVADAVARVIGSRLELETGREGIVRAVTFRMVSVDPSR